MLQPSERLLRAFLCYAKDDKPKVLPLYNRLLTSEVDVWFDEEKLLGGQNWQQEIPNAVKRSDVFIVCLSKKSIDKEGYIQKEIKFALDMADEKAEGSIYIIPVRLEDCEVPERFNKIQWTDFFEENGYDKLLRTLIAKAEQINAVLPSKNKGLFPFPHSISDAIKGYPIQFREEIIKPIFLHLKNGEAFYVIGAPSVGKTRLMDFLMGDDPDTLRQGLKPDHDRIKKHYLGPDLSAKAWLVYVNQNRSRAENDWGFRFFELLLSSLLLACDKCEPTGEINELRAALKSLESEVIDSKDALKAYRFFEMGVSLLCQSHGIRICFLFDEFDDVYKSMPSELFTHLRAIRDANKYLVSYGLFLRNLPNLLRDPTENESFYELLSRNMIGIGSYSAKDTYHIIRQLEKRWEFSLPQNKCEWVYVNSGGHPGLIQALFTIFKQQSGTAVQMENIDWLVAQESVREEFRKLWAGLAEDEQNGLLEFARGGKPSMSMNIGKLLTAKGLLKPVGNEMILFSQLFGPWLLTKQLP